MIRNFLKAQLEDLDRCHEGIGTLKHVSLFNDSDFKTNLHFINYTVLPPHTTIGLHPHGNDEELYIVLEGRGVMTLDGQEYEVQAGDVIVNKPFGTHGLANNCEEDLKILVLEAT